MYVTNDMLTKTHTCDLNNKSQTNFQLNLTQHTGGGVGEIGTNKLFFAFVEGLFIKNNNFLLRFSYKNGLTFQNSRFS